MSGPAPQNDLDPMRTVLEILERSARQQPDRVAALSPDGHRSLTYAEFAATVHAWASRLTAAGVTRSDVVMVSLPSGPEGLAAIVGVMCSCVCAPMNPAYTMSELADLAAATRPAAVIASAEGASPAARLASDIGVALLEVDTWAQPQAASGNTNGRPLSSDIALLLHTAGTTARPKQVPLTHANLAAAAANVVASLSLRPEDRCLNVMPLFHSHGLLGAALSSLAAGASIVCAESMDPRRFLDWASTYGASWYTAAPTVHQLALDAPGEWKGFRFIRSASAPIPPQVAAAIEEKFEAPLIEVYGMTEAYQISANPLTAGARRLGTVGRATGTELAILDASLNHAEAEIEGEVIVRGPSVFSGYSSPHDNTDTFVEGWFRTGDLGYLSADGFLTITGRSKEQINRGGEKVAPREVDEAVLAHPDVKEAMAFAIPDALLGEEVGVAVVLEEGCTLDAVALRRFLSGKVSPFKVPRRVVVVDELPKSSTGKLLRIGFASQIRPADVTEEAETGGEPRGDTVTDRLAALWQELLELDSPPKADDRYFDLGGTSLLTMELVVRLETDFGVDLPVIDVIEVPALADLAAHVESLIQSGPRSAPLLRPYRVAGSRTSMILVPGAMGMAVGLQLIADELEPGVDVYLFDYPGHRGAEHPRRSIDALADALVQELERAGLTGDIGLYGNSMGSWVVYETARRMRAAGRVPRVVCIGDMYSPRFAGKDSPLRPSFSRRVLNRVRKQVRKYSQRRPRPASGTIETSIAVRRRDAVFAASQNARKSYADRPYAGELIVFSTTQRSQRFGNDLGWQSQVAAPVSVVPVPGTHDEMHVKCASLIGDAINAALRGTDPKGVDELVE